MNLAQTALLASIDEALAASKAALTAGDDGLAGEAASMIARLPTEPGDDWPGVPPATFAAIRNVHEAVSRGDLAEGERRLERARTTLGGPSS